MDCRRHIGARRRAQDPLVQGHGWKDRALYGRAGAPVPGSAPRVFRRGTAERKALAADARRSAPNDRKRRPASDGTRRGASGQGSNRDARTRAFPLPPRARGPARRANAAANRAAYYRHTRNADTRSDSDMDTHVNPVCGYEYADSNAYSYSIAYVGRSEERRVGK